MYDYIFNFVVTGHHSEGTCMMTALQQFLTVTFLAVAIFISG
jgi:hypothetical protein